MSRCYPRGSDEFSRVLNFSDGVMAIALTLLVLNIDLPVPKSELWARTATLSSLLGGVGPQLIAFLVSFVIVAYAWVGHHRLLAELARIDGLFIQWNFAFLLLVVLFLASIPAAQLLGSGIASWLWLATWALEGLLDRILGVSGDE